jgi:hypothetical protein
MQKKTFRTTTLLIGGLVLLLLGAGVHKSLQATLTSSPIYSAKFVCGIMPNLTTLGVPIGGKVDPNFLGAVNPGRYTTAVNIQNLGKESVTLKKQVTLAPREPKFGTTTASITMTLPPGAATNADCQDIYSFLIMSPNSSSYEEGFISIVPKGDVHVVAVYTVQNLRPDGTLLETSSIEVERIQRAN